MVSPGWTMIAVPPFQFQPCFGTEPVTSRLWPGSEEPLPVTAGRVAGAPVGGGSGALCTLACFCGGTEPVTSFDGALERNGLTSKRWVSALQLTRATATVASMARRRR